jgi:uncharacterized repeat protein (TIGR01451 family)
MDYSGDYVGGFVGTLRGNIGFVEKYYEDTKIIEITGHPNIGEKAKHEFTNCYAAGEVGGITSDYAVYTAGTKTAEGSTSEDSNTETIGGFIGAYRPEDYGVNTTDITSSTSIDGIFTNCYYDKQTTAMHERDIGNYTNYDSSGNQTGDSYALSGTMGGITGVYTQTSEKKVVNGLSNTTVGTLFPTDSDKWTNENECYPQLINMKYLYGKNNSSIPPTDNDAEKAMYEERAQLFKDYAYASTAAVFLDHYDQTLTNTDELENCTETTVYDTVRDITSKFDFSTMTGISWTVNTARNKTSGDNGFHGKMGPHDVDEWENGYESDSSGGFSIDYTISDDGEKHTVTQNPYVIKIAKNATTDNKYRCVEFAPGKQWVKVTYGKASRSLRLLPSAYLSAGGEIDVNVLTDTTKNTDGTTSENTTNTVTLFDGSKRVTLDKFRHYVGVAYAISDRTRMANYNYKDLAEYKTDNGTNTDTDSFALYAGYTIGKAPNMGVGLDESTDMMYTQYFAVEGQKNDSSEGLTAVKIYKTKKGTPIEEGNKTSYQLLKDETQEITDSNSAYYTGTGNNYADTIAKWTGKANFTKEDTGYYYMEYNWRLNDGRYLSDLKLVRIKSDSHTIEMITGIANQKHTVDETAAVGTYSSAIDQYVTDEFEDSNTWTKSYPSLVKADGEGTNLTDNNATEFYKYYNTGVDGQDGYYTYDGDNYYLKANSVTTPNSDTVVGWRRTTDYELTSLIIQAKKTDSYTWETLARSDGSSNTLDFTNAQYKFNFTGILSEQDSQSKIYTITEIENDVETFSIESSVLDGIENYIKLNIDTGESSYQSYIIDDDIRVVALFRPTSANVLATKSVLINAPEPTSIEAVEGVVQSVETASKAYSVDDTGVTDNGNRKAVIGGDEITYRVKLRNAGYYDSSEVNVYDTIPDGCTFVEGSMKIYEQVKDTTTKTAVYQQAVDITDDCNTTNVNGKLTWTLPTVKLTSDYYVEYKVKVPSAGLTDTKDVLKNTATWDFVAMSGDRTKQDAGDTSIKNYQDTALFNMTIDDGDDAENAEYTITFKQKYTTSGYTYHDITFTDYLPTDFEIDSEYGIKFTDSEDNEITDVKIETDFNSTDKKFTISGFELNPNTEYKVTFKGKRVEPTEENPTVTDEATIIYYRDKVNSTDTSGNTTEGAENSEVSSTATETSSTLLGNKISKTTSLTNQVETDITHLYLNVEKTIAVDDPSQTFLFRIDRYDSSTATTPTDTYYTQVQCTTEVTTKNAETGKEEVTGYSGSQLVQVDKRGYYTVTEVTDWSSTDYDFGLSSYTDVTDTATAFDSTETSANGSVSTSTSGSTVSFALPRQQYISTAFPTTYGVPSTAPYPTVSFTNTESEYAYLSGQSYAENTIKLKTDTTTENSGDSEENGNGGNNGTGDGNGDGDDDENAN